MSNNSEEIPGFVGTHREQPKLVYKNPGEASRKKQRSEDVKDFSGWTGKKCSRERKLHR